MWQNQAQLVSEKSANELVAILIDKYLADKYHFRVEAKSKIEQEVSGLSSSLSEENPFTRETINSSLEKFSSTADKLAFLDSCYKEFAKPQNPSTNRSFFMRLLCGCDNQVIDEAPLRCAALLKEAMNEVIDAHQTTLEGSDQKEFQWLMDHRDSELAHCNIDQSYITDAPTQLDMRS